AARALPSSTCAVTSVPLVVEVAYAGEVQRDTRGLGGGDDEVVADRAAGVGDGAHPGLGQDLEAGGEREVGVAGRDRAGGAATGPRGDAPPSPPRSRGGCPPPRTPLGNAAAGRSCSRTGCPAPRGRTPGRSPLR